MITAPLALFYLRAQLGSFGPDRTFEAPYFPLTGPSKRILMPRAAFHFVYTLCRAHPKFTADYRAITEIGRQFKVSQRTVRRV